MSPITRAVAFACLFGMIGPGVGSAAVTGMIFLAPQALHELTRAPMTSAAYFATVVFVFGYVLGTAPAALTGAILGLLDRPALPNVVRLGLALLFGGLNTALLAFIVFPRTKEGDSHTSLVALAAIGALSAVVCALIVVMARYARDNRSKRRPA